MSLRRKRTLGAKIEAVPGTAETITAADCAINAYDPVIQANIDFEQRPRSNSFSQLPGELGPYEGTLTFTTDLIGDGAGGVPFWASVLLPACGYVNNAGTFTPRTEPPGANVKTLTMSVFQDGKIKQLRGAAGDWNFVYPTGRTIMLEFTFTGVWVLPVDGAAPVGITYPVNRPFRFAAADFTIGGAGNPACVEQLTLSSGNNVIARPCPTPTDGSGVLTGIITDRRPIGTLNPEARTVTAEDVYGKWLAGTPEIFNLEFDDGSDKITFNGPSTQRYNIQEGNRDELETDDIEFQFNTAGAGDDELSITFAASS